jgi:hypothetical protein
MIQIAKTCFENVITKCLPQQEVCSLSISSSTTALSIVPLDLEEAPVEFPSSLKAESWIRRSSINLGAFYKNVSGYNVDMFLLKLFERVSH